MMMKNSLLEKGNKAFRAKNYSKALEYYQKALALYTDSSMKNILEWNLEFTYLKLGKPHEAKVFSDENNHPIAVSASVQHQNKVEINNKAKLNLSSGELMLKLWGGFSNLALNDLEEMLSDKGVNATEKAKICYALARWYAAAQDWLAALGFLKRIRQFDINLYRDKKIKLLLIQAYCETKNFDQANEMIKFALNQRKDNDFICAYSNFYNKRNGVDSAQQRVNLINEIYQQAGFSPVSLLDNSKGLVFGNLGYSCSRSKTVEGPKISILVPVYGAEEFVEVAIKSLLNQTWKNLEIIAVEDCGPDNSWSILERLSKEDPRLKVYKNDTNLGAYSTRNRALHLATGEYITVHDSDDWSHPEMLEAQMKEMAANPKIKISCSAMCRVHADFEFMLRPQRNNLEYIHRSYPSVLIKRKDLGQLGEWDGVSANADDEFVQRARMLWGNDSVVDVYKDVPFSFFLVHENSLTQQKGTSLNSLTFGIRREYARQAEYWRKNKKQDALDVKRTSLKHPFPIPQGLAPKNWKKNTNYDLVLVSDLSLLGGTRRCNEGYIQAAIEMGWRVGLFHWPRYELRTAPIADEYLELSYNENVDILVREDEISADLVLIHHPPILKYEIDAVPKITCKKTAVLVNQSPMQLWSQKPFYYEAESAENLVEKLFGHKPTWIAISPRVIQTLQLSGGFKNVHQDLWFPPYNGVLPETLPELPKDFGSKRKIRLGRHARNHWTKWPGNKEDLTAAYCGGSSDIEVHLLGGAETPKNILGELPSNWTVYQFDSITVSQFVSHLDFFLHFTHHDYIEEFGRNIMEAMAAGKVVILPLDYQDVFGDAAVYSDPREVESMIHKFWNDKELYKNQARRGFDFVSKKSSLEIVKLNLRSI